MREEVPIVESSADSSAMTTGEVTVGQTDAHRWYSVMDSNRIQEIAEYDTPSQHVLPENHGTGLIGGPQHHLF